MIDFDTFDSFRLRFSAFSPFHFIMPEGSFDADDYFSIIFDYATFLFSIISMMFRYWHFFLLLLISLPRFRLILPAITPFRFRGQLSRLFLLCWLFSIVRRFIDFFHVCCKYYFVVAFIIFSPLIIGKILPAGELLPIIFFLSCFLRLLMWCFFVAAEFLRLFLHFLLSISMPITSLSKYRRSREGIFLLLLLGRISFFIDFRRFSFIFAVRIDCHFSSFLWLLLRFSFRQPFSITDFLLQHWYWLLRYFMPRFSLRWP